MILLQGVSMIMIQLEYDTIDTLHFSGMTSRALLSTESHLFKFQGAF